MAEVAIDTLNTDTLTAGGMAAGVADTVSTHGMELHYGMVMERPSLKDERPVGANSTGMSWILTILIVLFVAVCLRYRKNTKYFSILLAEITEMRDRHNAFNDTLRETSFVWLLNILWCGSAGILLYGMLFPPAGGMLFEGVKIGNLAICIGMAGAFTLFLTVAYYVVGNLFSDTFKASSWVKSYLSTQGLEGIIMFPIALVALCVPGLVSAMIILGVIVFLLAKLLFIYKGFCIFFTEMTSWVLFLYYLCSLEIVPIVLTYVAASSLCGVG